MDQLEPRAPRVLFLSAVSYGVLGLSQMTFLALVTREFGKDTYGWVAIFLGFTLNLLLFDGLQFPLAARMAGGGAQALYRTAKKNMTLWGGAVGLMGGGVLLAGGIQIGFHSEAARWASVIGVVLFSLLCMRRSAAAAYWIALSRSDRVNLARAALYLTAYGSSYLIISVWGMEWVSLGMVFSAAFSLWWLERGIPKGLADVSELNGGDPGLDRDFIWGSLLASTPFFLFGLERVLSSRLIGESLAHYNAAFEMFLRSTALFTLLGMISIGWLNRERRRADFREVLGEGVAFSLITVAGAMSFGPPLFALILGPAFDPEVTRIWMILAPALGFIGLGQSGLSVVMVKRRWKWLVVSYGLMPLILGFGAGGSAEGLARAVVWSRIPDLVCFAWAAQCSGGIAWRRAIFPAVAVATSLLAPWPAGAGVSIAAALWVGRSGLWRQC